MKIKVDRNLSEDQKLVFTITVTDPHHSCFGEIENKMMSILDVCKNDIDNSINGVNKTKDDIIGLIHAAKKKLFMRLLNDLKFSIENELRPKFRPICQEIYNWIQDQQTDMLKTWMIEFDPQRTKYYFDNDNKNLYSTDPLDICDDKIDDDEDEDEDE